MSIRLLHAWSCDQAVLHTAIDDLESFLWVLVWTLVHIFKEFTTFDNAKGTINTLTQTYSSYDFSKNQNKALVVKFGWGRAEVFGGLIHEWLEISQRSHRFIVNFQESLLGWDEFTTHCEQVYIEYIQAGFMHLEQIKNYSTWEEVVVTNRHSFAKM